MMNQNRLLVEKFLLEKYNAISPLTWKEHSAIDSWKDGSFGLSNLAFRLYSNGTNLRGQSKFKNGLFFLDKKAIFSIGIFRKEGSTIDSPSYMFFVSPRGQKSLDIIEKIIDDVKRVFGEKVIKGFYVRFLNEYHYKSFLNRGFLSAKAHPWHPEAPEEDETYTNSILTIDDLIDFEDAKNPKVRKMIYNENLSRNSRKKVSQDFNRFNNFLNRNNSQYKISMAKHECFPLINDLVKDHFKTLEEKEKNVGSSYEDYIQILKSDLLRKKDIFTLVGKLDNNIVSAFVGEKISQDTIAFYATFSNRNYVINLKSDTNIDNTGITAIGTFAYVQLFTYLKKKFGIKKIHLGGSETPDLNRYKRRLGCKIEPSHWVYKGY